MSEDSKNADILYLFFKPLCVAIIGLSRTVIDALLSVLMTLRDFGYEGRNYIINPNIVPTADAQHRPQGG